MRRLNGASLLEAVVAAVLFLTVFAAVMELVPRLTVRDDDALLVAEAEYRIGRTFEKYATGLWPCGEYTENYDWGRIIVSIDIYSERSDMQVVSLQALIDGSRKRIGHKQVIECGN
ncbi:hypothetical protein [uncultured Alistipes sp.]|jgi:hypothetical protein|uniref:hypothetical protein n=1 Tax=uncultured Alistipes sp. TaxID=538949 RepID=UPI0025DD8D38|nr:hypothetical protein [uncultured Alistipes sp.]